MDFLARFVGIWLAFVVYIAVDVEGVAYGAACTGSGTGDCTETTNIVCDTTCQCATGFFRLTTSNACSAQILLNEVCTASPVGQCADTLAACDGTALLCKCTSGNFENKDGACAAQKSGLTTACDATDPATDQCDVSDSECRVDGTAQCLCKATHYTDGSACTIKKEPSIACVATSQCVTNAECDTADTNTCVCNAGYTATPTAIPTMCSLNTVAKFANLPYMYVVPVIVSMMSFLR